jgi:hypothetical protein
MKFLNHNLFTGDITVNGTTTLSTATGITRTTGDNSTHLATTAFVKAQDYATNTSLGNYVPVSRTLTINGVTFDLSANRAWTIGTSDYTSTLKHTVKAGVAITKGQAVYVTSADGTNMIVGLASNTTEATSSKTMGLIDTTVAANGFTSVITEGLLAGLNTLGATAGDPVWLGTGGNLIYGLTNKPYAPAHLVFIGIVTRVNANNGEIFVKVQNGFELKEIHDVDLITTAPINGHLLGYNGTLWVNKTIAGWLGYTPANASGTTNYLSKFTGSTTLGNSLVYDNGTNVGIGTTSPSNKLQVANGDMSITTGYSFILADTDTNWRLGRNIISETGNQLTANTMQFIAANAANEGWQFVDDDGNTRFEIGASTGNAWLPSGNLYLNGNLAATQSWVTSQGYLTSYTETDTLASVTGRGASTSTNSVFTGGLQARKNQTDNNYTTAALWTESYGNTTTGIAFHISGNVGKFLEMRTNGVLYWDNAQVWTAGNDGAGSGLDADLLDGIDSSRFIYGQSGNRRGTNLISNWNQNDFPDVAFLSAENAGTNAPTGDYTYGMQYSFHRDGAAYRSQLVTALYSDTSIYVRNSRDSDVWTSWKRIWHSGDFTSTNVSNWNTAYGWGNHASAGYAAASSLANYLPLAGGTMSGTLNFQQPVGLGFANGQYIKDNSAGGLIIYSGAAVNINGTSITISNNTTVSGWLGVTGIVSANSRKLSLGILDLNSGVTPAQYKIKTSIPWNYGGSDFTVNIKGFRYGSAQMVSLSIGWHYYNNEFYNRTAISNGAWAPTISLAKSPDGYVIIYIPGPDYWPKLYVESVYSSNSADAYTSGWSWSDADLSDCTLIQTVPYGALATNISGNAATATNVAYSGLTGTVPTWNQNTTGNAATSSTFSTGRTNYKGVTDNAVAGQLMWKNYGNNHTIFDASNSTSPSGGAVNNANSQIAWTGTYPTLMGWNGSETYGVRVDSARLADTAGALTSMNISQFTNNSGYITSVAFDNLTSKSSGTGTYQTSGDFRAPIFYDSQDTGYYVDPNSTSNLYRANFNAINIGAYSQYSFTLPYPGANYGNGRIYIRLQPIQTRIVSFKIKISSTWNWAAAFGYISADVSYYCDGTNIYYPQVNITSATGMALGSLALGDLVIENGYVSLPVYSSNSNGIDVKVEGSPSFDFSTIGYSSYASVSFPGPNTVNIPGAFSVGNNSVLTTATFNVNGSSTITLTSAGTNASMIKAGAGDELYIGGNNTWQMRFNGGNVLMDNGGYLQNDQSLRAPIFYDSDDTGFYVDPNGTSNLRKFSAFTMAYNGMNPMSANSPYVDRYNGSAGYRNGTMGYVNTDFNVIARNWGSGFIDTWSSPANAPGGSTHYIGLQGVHYSDGGTTFYGFQMACAGEADNRFFWRSSWPSMRNWVEMIHSGTIGSQSVSYATTAGNSGTATALQTGRTLTIGSTGKTFDGTGNVSWTLGEIGAQAAGSYVVANGTSAGDIDADWGQSFKTFDPVPTGTPPLASPNIRTINIGENFGRRTQLAFDYASDVAYFRRRQDTTWGSWREFIHSGNIGSQTVATAGALSSMNISQFTNNSGYITGYTETNTFLGDGGNADTHPGTDRIIFTGQLSLGAAVLGMPSTDNSNAIININRHPGEYNSQLGFSSNGSMYYRSFSAAAINNSQAWRQVWDSGNLTNLNQLTNGPGYITSYTETDTLGTVTNRGNSTSQNIVFSNGRKGLVGVYNAAQTQAIFAMGIDYILTDGGASGTIGNHYGLAWSYNPDYGGAGNNPQSKAGLNHQLLLMQAGVTTAAMGSGIWTSGNISAANFSGSSSGTNTGDQTNITGNAGTIDSNPNRTDVAAYPVVWSNGAAQSPNYSCAAVTIQSSTGTLNATNLAATRSYAAIAPTVASANWNTSFSNTPLSTMAWGGDISAGGPTGTWWFQVNMRHSNGSNLWGTQLAYGWEDNANEIYQRNVTGGNFSGWVRYINTNNYAGILDARYYTETEINNFFSGATAITGYNKSNWDTAFGWGNHASAGYITGNQTITLSGVVTGSGTTAITTAIANGAITNAMLANSSFFVGTTSISLGRATAAQTLTGVSIDGNAGFADEAKWISYPDGPRDLSDRSPSWNNRSVAWDFVGAGTANGSGNYGGVMTFVPWDGTSASTGDSSYQLAFANTTGVNASGQPKLSIRNGINSTWNAWYTIIHSGNIGDQSVSNASTAGGLAVHGGRNNEVNKIVRTDANGYIQAGWINTTSGAFNSAINKIYCSDDDYIRYQTPANFISNLGLITTSNIGSQSVSSATTATVVVTIQDDPPAGVNGKLWWESDTGKLKVYYGTSSAWVDATPVPDMSLYYAKAGGPISGDVTIQQTLTVVGNTLIQGTLTETSDISLKENILPLESSLDKVMKLNGVSFNKKATPNVKEIGFIAQEVEAVIPDLVTETNEGIKTVSYSRVTAVLVETIKEQQAQINELKDLVSKLAEKLNSL